MTTLHARGLAAALLLACAPAAARAQDDHQHHRDSAPPTESAPAPAPDPHAGHDMTGTARQQTMTGALGPYPMTRDASGTAWQPDASPHMGAHSRHGDWTVMTHALLNAAYTDQGGPRGGEKAFVAGMVMGMAQRPLGDGTLALRAMLSPDPWMGKRGYPLLLAAGESADGVTPLIDRQHPHELFMELSASWSLPLTDASSLYLYAGLPGEPAYGPPSFMHRLSGLDSPEAPISHHWMDSTHITFGVLTAGYVHDRWKVEASAFRGREPDQHRFDIETGALDSAAARLSVNPTENWSLQVSAARIKSPEALDPHHDEDRVSASAAYVAPLGETGRWAATLAVARKDQKPGDRLWAAFAEAAVMPDDRWTLFARAERVEQNELESGHGEAYPVGRLSLGAIRDFRVSPRVKLGLGALVSAFDIPRELKPLYGEPSAATAFVRLKVE